jgi:hypothetical protein
VFRRIASASVLSLLVLAVGATSVFAHECYNASRSAQGNTGAQHSDNWFNLSLELLYTVILPEETGVQLSEAGLAFALEESANAGIPDGFVIRVDKTIGFNEQKDAIVAGFERNGADGHGIDHAVAAYGDQIFAIFAAAAEIP